MAFSKEKAHERAEKFAAKGQHDKAAREYQSIVENDPKDIRAWLMLADCLVRSGDRNGAIDRYMQVAGYYSAQQQPQKALAVYRQVVNLDPRRFDVHQRIAQLNLDLGRVPDAVAIYEQLGQAQLQAGAVAEALVTFETIANAEPAAVPKRLRVAELYSRERQVEKAVEHFRIAGEQLLQTGRHTDFVRVAERLVYHQPDDGETIRKLAHVYLQLGDPRRALMKLNALLHADAHDRVALELLAETFLALEKPDKATSVAVELVRQLVAEGESGAAEAQRVARRALAWDPTNSELRAAAQAGAHAPPARATAQPAAQLASTPAATPPQPRSRPSTVAIPVAQPPRDDVDELSDDVVELDDADVVAEGDHSTRQHAATQAQTPERAPARSLTDRVLSETETPQLGDAGVDLDKILFEARVYVKYRLFEHAIEHVTELLAKQPEHTGALALRARALGELGRRAEAAEVHVQVARLVLDRDPRLAREHLGAALDCDPSHVVALALRSDLDRSSRPLEVGDTDGAAGEGDSGTFDLVGADGSGPIATSAGETVSRDQGDGDDFAIDVADSEHEVQPTRPISIETRFDLSDAGPLPQPDEQLPTENLAETLASARGFDASTEHADRTPLFGYSARPPGEGGPAPSGVAAETTEAHRISPAELDLGMGGDHSTGRFEPMSDARAGTGGASTRLVEPSVDLDGDVVDADDLLEAEVEPMLEEASVPDVELVTEEREVPIPPGKPLTPRRSTQPNNMPTGPVWPDLQDELAEIRFFLDQGLDDDARAGLGDLERKHPGHPEVAKLQAEFDRDTAGPQADSGAKPLVELPSEDEDEDAYLSAIFGGGPKVEKKKDRGVEIRAAGGADAADAASSYDLGMAYRDMGLVDDAITQFELAAGDALWQARALVMSGTLRLHRGETDRALADLRGAIDAATNEDELFEAKYELAQIYETLGEADLALDQLHAIEPGYRERDAKIAALGG